MGKWKLMTEVDQWKLVTAMVVVFAFSLEMRPLDSYLTAYLTSPSVNATLQEVSEVLTPFRIFCSIFGSFLVFLLSDYLRYKPVMIFNGLAGMLAYICLMSSPTINGLKLAELGLSLFTCAEVAYCGYLFAKIRDKEQYQIATGYVKAGTLSGTCLSGILGQLTVYWTNGDYSTLPYFSLAGVTFATIWAFFMPTIERSTYFHVDDEKTEIFSKSVIHNPNTRKYITEKNDSQNNAEQADTHPADSVADKSSVKTQLFKRVYGDFKHSYENPVVRRWCYWHTIGLTGYIQIYLYINVLYTYIMDMSDDKDILLNGLVDSLANICAAFCSYNIGKLDVDWTRYGDTLLTISSLTIGLPLLMCFYLKNIIFVYPMYIVYVTLVQSVFVIIISQIAKELKDDCFTLVLGFNAFLAIILSTVMSMLLVQLGISVPGQFLIYGSTYIILGVFYGCTALFNNKIAYELPA